MTTVPVFMVLDNIIECDANNSDVFGGKSATKRIDGDVFSNIFKMCIGEYFEELDHDFKFYSDLTQYQGQIHLIPGVKIIT